MFLYFVATVLGTSFILFARRLVRDDTAMNMVASFILVCLLLYLLPELRAAPVAAMLMAWLLAFVGLQFAMPAAEGQPFAWQWGTRRFVLAEIITAG